MSNVRSNSDSDFAQNHCQNRDERTPHSTSQAVVYSGDCSTGRSRACTSSIDGRAPVLRTVLIVPCCMWTSSGGSR